MQTVIFIRKMNLVKNSGLAILWTTDSSRRGDLLAPCSLQISPCPLVALPQWQLSTHTLFYTLLPYLILQCMFYVQFSESSTPFSEFSRLFLACQSIPACVSNRFKMWFCLDRTVRYCNMKVPPPITENKYHPLSAYLTDKPYPELFTNFVGKSAAYTWVYSHFKKRCRWRNTQHATQKSLKQQNIILTMKETQDISLTQKISFHHIS